jgi:hypothetical protein
MFLQIVVPPHRLLLGVVRIHDDLLLDALLSLFVSLGFGHVSIGAQRVQQHDANFKGQPEGRKG